jgi:hypothetical protein
MKLTSRRLRRTVAVTAFASAAIMLPAVALAASAGGSTPAKSAAVAVNGCVRSQLTAWLGYPFGGTAGSTYYELEISNISRTTCTLRGYPGVSAYGHGLVQLGSPANRVSGHPIRTVTLTPGGTSHVILRITDVGALPGCDITNAIGLRIYAPNDFGSMTVPLSFQACANTGPLFLHVSNTIAGAGIPGYSF